MAKTRLNQWDRKRLLKLAVERCNPKAERKRLDKTLEKAAALVRKVIETKYPAADMAVLAKYQYGREDTCFKLRLADGSIDEFRFPDGQGIRVANRYYLGDIYDAGDAKTTAAAKVWRTAADAFEAERKKRIAAYEALIAAARYFEDVTAVWVEAEELREAICGKVHLPALLTEDLAVTIQADAQERIAA